MKRRGVQVRYRTGYLAPPPVAASEEDRAIGAAFANPGSVERDDFLVSHTSVGSVRFTEVDRPRDVGEGVVGPSGVQTSEGEVGPRPLC